MRATPRGIRHVTAVRRYRAAMWAEMIECFFDELSRAGAGSLLGNLHAGGLTCDAEFESYLHPHLVGFPPGHRRLACAARARFDLI